MRRRHAVPVDRDGNRQLVGGLAERCQVFLPRRDVDESGRGGADRELVTDAVGAGQRPCRSRADVQIAACCHAVDVGRRQHWYCRRTALPCCLERSRSGIGSAYLAVVDHYEAEARPRSARTGLLEERAAGLGPDQGDRAEERVHGGEGRGRHWGSRPDPQKGESTPSVVRGSSRRRAFGRTGPHADGTNRRWPWSRPPTSRAQRRGTSALA